MGNAVCTYCTREGMIILGDVFWGQVNSCRADRSVSFRVGGAAVALIMVGLEDFTPLLHTHTLPSRGRWLSLSRRPYVP